MGVFGGALVAEGHKSSRFGRYTTVHFDGSGKIKEIRFETHLFEKIRVVHRPPSESNFLALYQLVIGSYEEEKEPLGLLPLEEYRFLSGKCLSVDPSELDQTREWMTQLGFTLNEIDSTFEILSAVLLIGNLNFISVIDGVSISNQQSLAFLSRFCLFPFFFIFFIFLKNK